MRIKNKLVAAALSFTLAINAFCGISVNAAETESVTADQVVTMEETNELAGDTNSVEPLSDFDDFWDDDDSTESGRESVGELWITNLDGQSVSSLVASNIKNKTQLKGEKSYATYLVTVPEGYNQDVIIPVKVKTKGALAYALAAAYDDDVYYSLYKDAACTEGIYGSDWAYLEKAGTYYIKVSKYELADEGDSQLAIALGLVSGANGVLKNNTNLVAAAFGTDSYIYYKFTVKSTSKVSIKIEAEYSKYVTLCNGKKTAITKEEYISSKDDKAVFAVGKGTYYIRVKATESIISITPKFTTMKSTAGPSKAKAGTIKVNGKTQNIAVLPGDSTKKYYYYKFYNPKNQKVYLNVTSNITSGKMEIAFYDSKNSKFGSSTIWNGLNEKNVYNPYVYSYSSNNGYKLPKGTYYIRFKKSEKKTSGTIQVNVKNKK